MSICNLNLQYCEPNDSDCAFPHFRGQQLICICLVYLYLFTSLMCIISEISLLFAISNRYIYTFRLSFSEYSSIYRWNLVNLWISLVCFQISLLYIVKSMKSSIFVFWYPLLNLCVQVSTGCQLQERRGRDHYFMIWIRSVYLCICFLKQLIICLCHSFTLYNLIQNYSVCSDLDFWILHKSSIYFNKSLAILRFP